MSTKKTTVGIDRGSTYLAKKSFFWPENHSPPSLSKESERGGSRGLDWGSVFPIVWPVRTFEASSHPLGGPKNHRDTSVHKIFVTLHRKRESGLSFPSKTPGGGRD